MHRFYCPDLNLNLLDEGESRHCVQVLRLISGDTIQVFDGKGIEVTARITNNDPRGVAFVALSETLSPPRRSRVTLAQALTKPKSFEIILQKATELGVTEIVPLQADRSVPLVDSDRVESRLAKWRQIVIEAAKQSGQNWLPEIQPIQKTRAFLASVSTRPAVKIVGSLQSERSSFRATLRENSEADQPVIALIGPEGDFSPEEHQEAKESGFIPVSLGPIILRSETAALYVLSAINYEQLD